MPTKIIVLVSILVVIWLCVEILYVVFPHPINDNDENDNE